MLTAGTRLGPYEIVGALGAGGMGEVYKAHDARLHRTVAIKVLPPELAADPDRRHRFHREAEAVAALNDPHICVLHDVGQHDGTDFLVMEHLEGETLASRLKRGPLPLELTIEYAVQIAGALATAHRADVIHRDLKPGNIMLTAAGAKLLDFGLAKLRPTAAVVEPGQSVPTATVPMTREGTVLGTLQYMPPEQLEGRQADARTDIFAFGAILYEMIAGRKAFKGHSDLSLISAILKDDPPPLSVVQPLAPQALDRLVRACLAKDPADRWQSAGDLKRELEWIREERHTPLPSPAVRTRERVVRWGAILAAAGAVLALVVVAVTQRRDRTDTVVARFTIPVPDSPVGTTSVPLVQIAPNGRRVAFIVHADRPGESRRIWLREIAGGGGEPIPRTEGVNSLFWSPDSEQLGFTTNQRSLKKLTISSRAVETLCTGCNAAPGGTWSGSGLIVFPSVEGPLIRIAAAGGRPEAATTLDRAAGEIAHIAPHFLPGSDRLLYVIRNTDPTRSGLYVGQVGSAERSRLLEGEHPAIYAPPGYLLFSRGADVAAQKFDLQRLELTGRAVPLVMASEYSPTPIHGGDIAWLQSSGNWPSFSASDTDMLAYGIAEHPATQFQWLSRSGELLASVGTPGLYQTFDLSPDGEQLVFSRLAADHASLWRQELSREVTSKLTFGAASYFDPRWGPGGDWVAANRVSPPPLAIVKIMSDGRESVLSGPAAASCILDDVSPDGRHLLCRPGGVDLTALPVGDTANPIAVRKAPGGYIDQPSFSPDGDWIAYNADESGRLEVYMTMFPPSGQPGQISRDGGVQPVWRQDGRELYYLGLDGILKAVEVDTDTGPRFSAPTALFDTGLGSPSPWVEQYTASADGQRFLILKPVEDRVRNSIGVILNWPALLKTGESR